MVVDRPSSEPLNRPDAADLLDVGPVDVAIGVAPPLANPGPRWTDPDTGVGQVDEHGRLGTVRPRLRIKCSARLRRLAAWQGAPQYMAMARNAAV
jgi:hypothetical protein